MSPRAKRAAAKLGEPAGLIAAVSDPQVVSGRWYRTTVRGVWYLDVGARLAIVYGGRSGWWWRAPGVDGPTEAASQRLAQLEAQRAVLDWCEAGRWTERRKRAKGGPGPKRFIPTKGDKAAAVKAPRLTAADIDQVMADAPAVIREVRDQLDGVVWPP